MEDGMVRLDEFNIDDSFKPVKFKTEDKKYFIKRYKKRLLINNYQYKVNTFINNELLLKDIKHPNLIEFKNKVIHKDFVYVYYKYYDFKDMLSFINDNKTGCLELYFFNKTIITQLIDVVKFLHKNNIVHRDIKVDNILYDEMLCKVYLCDYEFCCNNTTSISEFVGTKSYSPPEVINKLQNINYEKVDIWCLGIVVFIILSKGKVLKMNEYLKENILKKYLLDNEYEFITNLIKQKPDERVSANKLLDLNYFK